MDPRGRKRALLNSAISPTTSTPPLLPFFHPLQSSGGGGGGGGGGFSTTMTSTTTSAPSSTNTTDSPPPPPPFKRQNIGGSHFPTGIDSDPPASSSSQMQSDDHLIRLEQQREIEELNKRLSHCKDTVQRYESGIATVNRVWNGVVDEMLLIISRLDGVVYRPTLSSSSSSSASVSVASALDTATHNRNNTNALSFLQRLIQAEDTILRPDDTRNIERALNVRVESTRQIMSKVIDAITTERQRNDAICHRLSDINSNNNLDTASAKSDSVLLALREENSRLENQFNMVQTLMDDLHVKHRNMHNENAVFRDIITSLQQKVAELANDFEEAHFNLQHCQKQIDKLKQEKLKLEKSAAAAVASPASLLSTQDIGSGASQEPLSLPKQSSNSALDTNGGTSNDIIDDLRTEIQELKLVSESRLKECEQERQEKISIRLALEKERRESQLDERITSSRSYRDLQARCSLVFQEVSRLRVAKEQAERRLIEEIAARTTDREKLEEAESNHRKMIESLLAERDAIITKLKSEKEKLAYDLSSHLSTNADPNRIKELTRLVQTQQKELSKQRALIAKLNGDKSIDTEALASQGRIQQLTTEVEVLRKSESQWQEREKDLNFKIDVYKDSARDRREINEVRASERALQSQVQQLQKQIEENKAQMDATKEPVDSRVSRLESDLQSQNDIVGALSTELESVTVAYNEIQEQNTHLITQLAEKDDLSAQIISERNKSHQQVALLREELETSHQKLKALEELRNSQADAISKTNAQIKNLRQSIDKKDEAIIMAKQQIDKIRKEFSDASAASKEVQHALNDLRTQYESAVKNNTEMIAQLNDERTSVLRLQERVNVMALKKKKRKGASTPADQNEMEIAHLKNLLYCPICHEQKRTRVLTSCFHTFCESCITKAIQARNRNCPTCATRFDKSDLHEFFL